ncbi:uncharacterized protein P884DRAFT_283875 [Thermothelomyces heterothallicus CBS 202.75]|uniref:uncharacterized protein n=1 Tax=Thermothelomyces heterothallicus CBS 202.75 TaxID=1149848 RepID=UPI003743D271
MRVLSYRLVTRASRCARGPSFTAAESKIFQPTVPTSPAPSRPALNQPPIRASAARTKTWTSWDRLRERDEWEELDVWEEKIKEVENSQAAIDSQVASIRKGLAEMDPLCPEAIDRVQELRSLIEKLSSGARQPSTRAQAETVTIPKTPGVLASHYINGVRHGAGI